jgi:tetratricopeptide (TPR) repeat protein
MLFRVARCHAANSNRCRSFFTIMVGAPLHLPEALRPESPIMTETKARKPSIFISYSHDDKKWKNRLVKHLGISEQQGLLELWDDSRIRAGAKWYEAIMKAIDAGSIAILLVSSNSLTTDFILSEEAPRLLKRRDAGELRVFPIIVEPCDWEAVEWLKQMHLRPRDAKPLSGGNKYRRDKELTAIAKEIRLLLDDQPDYASSKPELANHAPEKISINRLPVTGRDLFGREQELKRLDEAWADAGTNVLSFVAWGGVGKSALVGHWLAHIAQQNYRGARRVYGWSFYSQGTTDRAVSADQFIEAALVFFGDTDPNRGSPWDKGERLGRLVGAQRSLLILDGLEPLQYPPGPEEGRLKDQSLQALLRQLAAYNEGLCIISTRVAITDLGPFEGHTATRIDLEHLSPHAGAQVLRAQGVKGSEAELEQVSTDFGGHSLALTLLGSYLSDVYQGDVTRSREVKGLEEDEKHGRHAQKVMASYEKWFGEGPELAVLRMLGLFNRPADKDAIAALRAAPAIPGLTDTVQGLTGPQWQRVLSRLRRAKLLAKPGPTQPGTLDTHPLVREHFGQQLKRTHPDAWREGNKRLYEHLKQTAKPLPDTLEEMAPLYAAVAHACEAGLHQEAWKEVYLERICRRDSYFNTRILGAYSADLALLLGFFELPWHQPISILKEGTKALALSTAGYDLKALGRLAEATQPMKASLASYVSHEQWESAAVAMSNLSQLYLTIGDLSQALTYAQDGVEMANKSENAGRKAINKSTQATVLHYAGRFQESEAIFLEAEEGQKKAYPQFQFLYSLRGARYCDLLLDQGKYSEVQTRSTVTLEVARLNKQLLDIALDYLSLGRAYGLQAQIEGTGDFNSAIKHLNQAVDVLRQAGMLEYLPLGLVARAESQRVRSEFDRARADLEEAMDIAERRGMGLHEADCYLQYARLYLAQGEKEKARESWARAREMVERMGYHRRDRDVEEIEELLKEE